MKTIKIKNLKVKEVILRPDDALPLAVLYELLDDTDQAVFTKRVAVKKEDMPPQGATALNQLVSRITERVVSLEDL